VYPVINVAALEEEISSASADGCLMLLDFYQPRCMSCRALGAKLDALARSRPELRVYNVNILSDGGKEIVASLATRPTALPTVAIYAAGEMVWCEVVSVKPREGIAGWDALLEAVDEHGVNAAGAQ
jgi:thioredoxin-like negative regulator of GroEL